MTQPALTELPAGLVVPEAEVAALRLAAKAAKAAKGRKERWKREFLRFDESWAEVLFPHLNPAGRLALVLLAEADFHRKIPVTQHLARAARLTRPQLRKLLKEWASNGG